MDLDCGIAYDRIASWLSDELSLPCEGARWTFAADGSSCTVTLDRLEPRRFTNLELERSHLVAKGDASAVDAFERLFTLRFMSAGG